MNTVSKPSTMKIVAKDAKELDNMKNEVKDMNVGNIISDTRKVLKDESNGIKVEALGLRK
ncbi:hypothetical protein [Clostridium sp. JS66]|uniref:hypothetical protein n=1 Tax=Clostridium sp. JS66 TaxID=3064705 RepID=UPI00298DD631|nr:hypothetical protein [Clostridium sp. JS66]WPC42637.1 hypothetical protein Q6H37_03975 [Clostridium sp. JS66]